MILDAGAGLVSQGLCCLPTEIELVAGESGRKPNAHNELVAQRFVRVKFKYVWVPWPHDSVCMTEWWEAVGKGEAPPSGYDPAAAPGVWNPSHEREAHGARDRETADASQKRNLREAKSSPYADDPENDDERVFMLDDDPWGGVGGRVVDVLVRAKSDCGAACLLMRYRYDGSDIDVGVLGVSFDGDCGDRTLSGPKDDKGRPSYRPSLGDWEDWRPQLPRDDVTLRFSSPKISPFRGRTRW